MNNNSMARAYGAEFNMSSEKIINIIEKIYKLEILDSDFEFKDIEVTLYNCDYYVRPGIFKETFLRRCAKTFKKAMENRGAESDDLIYMDYMVQVLYLIKEFFDEEYFKEQVDRRRNSAVPGNKDKLKMYMKRLDEEQLKEFLCMMVHSRRHYGLFISETSSAAFWEEIHNACRKAGCNVPLNFSTTEGERFLENNAFYFFDYLSKNTIANLLCGAIDLDVAFASSVAKKFYRCGGEATLNYINLKMSERHSA